MLIHLIRFVNMSYILIVRISGSCESTPKRVQTQRRRVLCQQNPHTARPERDGGRWGVAQACNCRSILDVIATLIEAQRPDLAMVLIEGEMNSQK